MQNLITHLIKKTSAKVYSVGRGFSQTLNNDLPNDGKELVVSWIFEQELKEIASHLGEIIPTPPEKGLFLYQEKNKELDIVLVRFPQIDGKFSAFIPIEDDLKNKLLTIDAVAFDERAEKIVNPYSGFEHILNRELHILNAGMLKKEPTSLIDIAIIASCGFELTSAAKDIISANKNQLKLATNRAIGYKLSSLMRIDYPKIAFDLLSELDLLRYVFPRLYAAQKVKQTRKAGVLDVASHILLCVNKVNKKNEMIRWAALYHDLGKTATKKMIDGKLRFFGHEKVSAKWAYKDLMDYGFSQPFAADVSHLVLHHMFDGGPQLTDEGVRRLIHRVGPKYIFDLLELRLADSAGFIGTPTGTWKITKLRERINTELSKNPFSAIGLDITSEDIKKIVSIDDSKLIEKIQELLLVLVLFNNIKNTKTDLIGLLTSLDFAKLKTFCPLQLHWLLDQQISRIENRADENTDGTLKCGKYCSYKCDNNSEALWQL